MSDLDADHEPIPPVPWALEKSCSPRAWCAGMTMALENSRENSETKGLSVSRGWYGESPREVRRAVIYRPRSRQDGIVLNFCPWCGRQIRFDQPKEKN